MVSSVSLCARYRPSSRCARAQRAQLCSQAAAAGGVRDGRRDGGRLVLQRAQVAADGLVHLEDAVDRHAVGGLARADRPGRLLSRRGRRRKALALDAHPARGDGVPAARRRVRARRLLAGRDFVRALARAFESAPVRPVPVPGGGAVGARARARAHDRVHAEPHAIDDALLLVVVEVRREQREELRLLLVEVLRQREAHGLAQVGGGAQVVHPLGGVAQRSAEATGVERVERVSAPLSAAAVRARQGGEQGRAQLLEEPLLAGVLEAVAVRHVAHLRVQCLERNLVLRVRVHRVHLVERLHAVDGAAHRALAHAARAGARAAAQRVRRLCERGEVRADLAVEAVDVLAERARAQRVDVDVRRGGGALAM